MLDSIIKATLGTAAAMLAFAAVHSVPASAQVRAVDPDAAIDSDLMPAPSPGASTAPAALPATSPAPAAAAAAAPASSPPAAPPAAGTGEGGATWQRDDLIGAAEGVFGKGASGLAELIEDLLRKQGEPNAYIVGREGGGALVFGLRYGSGTLYHKVEGRMPVYWTGPSLGLDAGANAASSFVLVYNLHDTADLYHRYGAGEGQAYLIGGFHVSYLRRGDVVLIPVRAGAGLRLGLNVGYMKFSHRQNWVPF